MRFKFAASGLGFHEVFIMWSLVLFADVSIHGAAVCISFELGAE